MKLRFDDVPVYGCAHTRRGKLVKKLEDGRCASISKKGKSRIVKCPSGDVKTAQCPISLLGAGLSSKGVIVEVGSVKRRVR